MTPTPCIIMYIMSFIGSTSVGRLYNYVVFLCKISSCYFFAVGSKLFIKNIAGILSDLVD